MNITIPPAAVVLLFGLIGVAALMACIVSR